MDNYLMKSSNDIIPYAENLLRSEQSVDLKDNSLPFLPSYLSKNIGRWVKVEHFLGNEFVSHIGQLISVGIDFIVLKIDSSTLATVVCNIKDICFITIVYNKNTEYLSK